MPGNEEQREAHHGVRAGQTTKENSTHVRQRISFTLFLREERAWGIESTRKKNNVFLFWIWKVTVREGNMPNVCLQGDKKGGSKLPGLSETCIFSRFVSPCCPREITFSPRHFLVCQLFSLLHKLDSYWSKNISKLFYLPVSLADSSGCSDVQTEHVDCSWNIICSKANSFHLYSSHQQTFCETLTSLSSSFIFISWHPFIWFFI